MIIGFVEQKLPALGDYSVGVISRRAISQGLPSEVTESKTISAAIEIPPVIIAAHNEVPF